MTMKLVLLLCWLVAGASFLLDSPPKARQATPLYSKGSNKSWNPFEEFSGMMSNLDDVIDDFMNKRLGNGKGLEFLRRLVSSLECLSRLSLLIQKGEIFYGKRKYKPSGRDNTTGQYNGMGMSDKARIDMAREIKEERMAMKRLREQGLKRDQN
eukprot:scaffold24671_cov137-Amphora_coffeaeformis.AAC.2